MNFKRTPVALAVAALMAAPLVMAQEVDESYAVRVSNSGTVSISNTSETTTVSRTRVTTDLTATSKAQSLVDDKQLSTGNRSWNYAHDNNASVEDTSGGGATGNIGVNTAAGAGNMQDNAAAIAVADAYFVFGSAEAGAMTTQVSSANVAASLGSSNNAALGTDDSGPGGGSFAGASGNIGINIAAGNGNLQKNNLSLATAPSRASLASVQNIQRSRDNANASSGRVEYVMQTAAISLQGGVSGTYSGEASGDSHGVADQRGDVYPDTWTGTTHPGGEQTGHIDLDSSAQGAVDLFTNGGALAFDSEGSYAGTERGDVTLSGEFSGTAVMTTAILHNSQNNAHLRGNALGGASGNIGVNIASGNGNLQNNSLSLATVHAPVAVPNGEVIPPTSPGSELR